MKKFIYEMLYELYWDICNNHYKLQQDGWMMVKDFKGIRYNDDVVYKDNIMLAQDWYRGNISMAIYVADNSTDHNPLLIYKIDKEFSSKQEGWG